MRRACIFSLFIIVLLLSLGTLIAQPYYFTHYQVDAGLSHNSVISIVQDREGFMWLGTKDGLNRFDGYSFKIFRCDVEDTTSLGNNFVQSLYEYQGVLWVGTQKGLYKYDARTEQFHPLTATLPHSVEEIAGDFQGNLWFVAGDRLWRYHEGTQELRFYDHPSPATSVCVSPDGVVWSGTLFGLLHRYDSARDAFVAFDLFRSSPRVSSRRIERIYANDAGQLLVGTQSQGVKLFDTAKGTYEDILPYDENGAELFVRDITRTQGNEYWIATESGIFIFDLKTMSYTHLRRHYNDPYSLSDNAVYTLCVDSEGGIWAGTYFGGANYYPKPYVLFQKFFRREGENSISGNAVREICEDRYGNLWIGTEDAGLNKFANGIFTTFMPTGRSDGLSYYNIHGLLAVGDELWIGMFERGLDVMDLRTEKIIRHYSAGNQKGAMRSNFVYSLHQTRNGDILVGTTVGMYRYDRANDAFDPVPGLPEHLHYMTMIDDHLGTLWAGTYRDGLYYTDIRTHESGAFRYEPGNPGSLASNAVNGVFEDSEHTLWVATDGGLCRFDRESRSFQCYTTDDGFPSNVIYNILEDDRKNLWVSTSKGLVCFDPRAEELKVYTRTHGLLSDQFNYRSAFKRRDGTMYFGSINGLIRFHPAAFDTNTFVPPIHITGFQVHNRELPVGKNDSPLQYSITFTDKITLPYDQSSFSIDFAALSYTAPPMVEYAYKMEGLDREWNYLKTNRKVYFTELPPGQYLFKVKASNGSGLWNPEARQLEIEILPPFWASVPARIAYILMGGLLAYVGFRSYHRQTEKKNRRKIELLENEKEKEVYQAKIEFFTSVAHEIRTPLTLIKGPLENVIRQTEHLPEVRDKLATMEKNTERLLDLVNQLLDFRSTEVKGFSLNFAKTDIARLVRDVYLAFKTAADQSTLKFGMDLPSSPLYAYVDREAMRKILSNLFNNAVKYAEHEIHVRVRTDREGYFSIEVRNDGFLIPEDHREKVFEPFFRMPANQHETGTGIGLPLARSLAELHKGMLVMAPPQDGFNVFVLTLPVHQDNEYHLYDDATVETEEEVVQQEEPEGVKPTVLLVEDNKELLDFIADELRPHYTVLKALTAERALEWLRSQVVQLVVSDIMMQGMDGFSLCREIKSDIESSHTPVILLTAKNTLQARIEGLECGADAYIEKPFSPEHLKVQIDNLIRNREKIKAYFSTSPLAHLKTIASSKADERFLERLHEVIYENIGDPNLNVDILADAMNMSRPTLYRKIKALSDLTPNELINVARLKKAAELLAEGEYKIYEVAEKVGYHSQTSFGRNFLKQFGMTPSEYLNQHASKKAVKPMS